MAALLNAYPDNIPLCNIHRASREGRQIKRAGRPPGSKNKVPTGGKLFSLPSSTLAKIRTNPDSTLPPELTETVMDRLERLVPAALARLEAIIRDDSGQIKPEAQMRAAEAILDRFAARRVSHETKTPAGQRSLDEELAPIIAKLRATGTDD